MTDTEKEDLQAAMAEIAAQIKAGIPISTVEPVKKVVYKKYAKIEADVDGYLVKTAGYLVKEGDTPPDGTIELTDEQEEKLNNGYYVVDLTTMELAVKPAHVLTVIEAQAAKLISLKNSRDAAEIENITYNDNIYDYDEKARERINAAIIKLDQEPAGATIDWTTATNTVATLTATDLKSIVAAVAVRSNTLHEHYRTLKAIIADIVADTTKTDAEKVTDINAVIW